MDNMEIKKENNIEVVNDILNAYVQGISTNSEVESIYMYTINQAESRFGIPIVMLNIIYNNETDIKKYRDLGINTIKYGINIATYNILRKNMNYLDLINNDIKILYDKNGELQKLQEFKTDIIKNFIQKDTIADEETIETTIKIV